jgi:fatty-acyl-CoA synthase
MPSTINGSYGVVQTLLRSRQERGRDAALHVINRRGREWITEVISFEQLVAAAERAAGTLDQCGCRAGDRVVLSTDDGGKCAAWFVGAIGRGIIPVIVPAGRGLGAEARYERRVQGIVHDSMPRLAVVDDVGSWQRRGAIPQCNVVDAAALDSGLRAVPITDQPSGSVAFLQYTSGSTGEPKGVVVTHGNLAANLRGITSLLVGGRGEKLLSWLPLYHDMGLVGGLLWPIFSGSEAFLMRPTTFLSRPTNWLQAITDFACTITVGPNFAYSVCVAKIPDRDLGKLDLRTLRLAMCGSEPVDARVARMLYERFARCGLRKNALYCVYGLAEATLAVAFPAPGSETVVESVDGQCLLSQGRATPASPFAAGAMALVSVGAALPGHSIEIWEPASRRPCGEGEVGEVVVRGPSVSPRYWSDPRDVDCRVLATGDLGYLKGGQLYIVGRLKELVIVAGEKYSPSQLESAAYQVAGVRPGRVIAFGSARPELGTEVAVVVAEIDLRCVEDPASLRRRIARAVKSEVGIEPEVVLVAPGSIEKTTSGKVRRQACATRYESGALSTVDDRRSLTRLRRGALLRGWSRIVYRGIELLLPRLGAIRTQKFKEDV